MSALFHRGTLKRLLRMKGVAALLTLLSLIHIITVEMQHPKLSTCRCGPYTPTIHFGQYERGEFEYYDAGYWGDCEVCLAILNELRSATELMVEPGRDVVLTYFPIRSRERGVWAPTSECTSGSIRIEGSISTDDALTLHSLFASLLRHTRYIPPEDIALVSLPAGTVTQRPGALSVAHQSERILIGGILQNLLGLMLIPTTLVSIVVTHRADRLRRRWKRRRDQQVCVHCRYPTHCLTTPVCPECGGLHSGSGGTGVSPVRADGADRMLSRSRRPFYQRRTATIVLCRPQPHRIRRNRA